MAEKKRQDTELCFERMEQLIVELAHAGKGEGARKAQVQR